ncbi:uncharacterized protein ACA1_272610 [Acanthamoeba castellanii str. Neff]|uniref:Uncharacterized protein n=1 Tax=Acanthamoeba castellanii (strain ATCC 30010 / Neff) TaxID=1257118 RepID=L8HHQ5_ACACF|nr:uncharacterized protein ACA1_272610 [Acanthamoeba castellanii str. Neff]ELR24238.1 hypothetical protein ACA1_272610 [Acanthamoeba castellanii str. Neff]
MPLCKPTIAAGSKLQWVTIKQDTHLALQECKIVGKSWWSSGDVSWGYRVIITATETQIAYAGDITQIVTDWEVLQKLVSEEPPLDPESSPAASAEVIERMLQRRWDEKQGGKEKQDGAESQSGKEKEKEAIVTDSSSSSSSSNTLSAEVKPTFEKRSSSRIFFRSGSTSNAIKRLAVGASESSPFPGIPLHREDQPSPRLGGGPNSPRARAATTIESPRSAAMGRSRDEESTTKPIPEAASAQNDQSGREREMREKYERSLNALKDKVAAPQHDDHYRVYVDCINSILHELQAVKNINGKGSPDEVQTTVEVLCQLSRTSLDAARMLVAQQKATRERVGVTMQVTAAEEEGSSSRPATEDEQQKAKEGQGDAEVGSGDTEKAMNSSAVDPSEQAKQEVDKNSSDDDAKKRLQRCVELFTAANKSLASMTQPPSDVAQE